MRRRGAALLTVLLLVAVMAGLAVAVLDDTRFALRRTGVAQEIRQARWYAVGAEALARSRIVQLQQLDPNRTTLVGDWEGRRFRFPIEGGAIEATVFDAGNCFNLNSLAPGAVPQLGADDEQNDRGEDEDAQDQPGDEAAAAAEAAAPAQLSRRQFETLLRALGISGRDASELAGALADWVDADQQLTTLGAEDEFYTRLQAPYRTGDALLAERSELRAVRGFTQEVYVRLRPHVCALPTPSPTRLNVNTLRPEDAVLLVALAEGRINLAQAAEVIEDRPPAGWAAIQDFWAHPSLSASAPSPLVFEQTALSTEYFGVEARVVFGRADVVLSALLQAGRAGRPRLLTRRWTADE